MRCTSIAVIFLAASACAAPSPPSPLAGAAADSMMAAAGGDTVLALVQVIEQQEQDLWRADIREARLRSERDWWKERAEDLEPDWFERVIRDPRLWFITGAALGAWAVD